jgi:hypothetical protein
MAEEGGWKQWGRGMAKELVAVRNTDASDDRHALTALQFGQLAEVPAELEWLASGRSRNWMSV